MKEIFQLSIILLLLFSCSADKRLRQTGIRISYSLESPNFDGELQKLGDSIDIFQFKQYRIYKKYYAAYYDTNWTKIYEYPRYQYLVVKDGEENGFLVNFNDTPVVKKINVNENLLDESLPNKIETYSPNNDSLVSSVKSAGLLVDCYLPKTKKGESYPDTSFFYYKKPFFDFGYKLSSVLDHKNRRKLYKVLMKYNDTPNAEQNTALPGRVMTFLMEPFDKVDVAELDSVIRRVYK